MSMGRSPIQSLDRHLILRATLLLAALLLALILGNVAAALYHLWRLKPGALLPGPWSGLLGANQVTRGIHLFALVGLALFGGASLSCLVFVLDRLLHLGWAWLREQVRWLWRFG